MKAPQTNPMSPLHQLNNFFHKNNTFHQEFEKDKENVK